MRSSNPQTPSSFEVLTPTRFLDRAAAVFADRLAIVDGERRFTYAEFHDRALRLTGVLAGLGVGPGERVAVLCANSHTMLELHTAIPRRAAVMVPLDTRLSEPELKYIIEHSGARLLIATTEFAVTATRLAIGCPVRVVLADGQTPILRRGCKRPHLRCSRSITSKHYLRSTTPAEPRGGPKG